MSAVNPTGETRSTRMQILIIGVGSIGERHLRCFQTLDDCDVAICETNAELRAEIAERYQCPSFSDLNEALGSGALDAAVVCTPASSHIPLARRCIGSGLHVLIEKPLSVSMEGIEELAMEAKAANRQIRVAYIYRFFKALQRAKSLLDAGVCGEVCHITVCSGQHFPTFRPAYRDIYYARRESGGGAIQDALTHQINVVEWLVSPVENLVSHAAHQVLDGVDVEDTVNLSAQLSSGALASFALNQFQWINETLLTFHGPLGSLRIELPANRIGTAIEGDAEWRWEELPKEARDEVFVEQARDFIRGINGVTDIGCTLEQGIHTLHCNLAALNFDPASRSQIQK